MTKAKKKTQRIRSPESVQATAKKNAGGEGARGAGRGRKAAGLSDPPRKRRADGRETRARVLQAAAEVFARDGLEGASLRRIAERASVDIATLKYHVVDKGALFAEVYQDGYEHFQQALGPQLIRVPLARDREELVREVTSLLERGFDYLEQNQTFVRLWLFRLLEGPIEVLAAEETLRTNVIGLIEAAVGVLRERGLVRDIDIRMVVLLIITALPTLVLGVKARPGWLGQSELTPRQRFIRFFADLLETHVLPPVR
jgi:AcrR family transcriptional regulator